MKICQTIKELMWKAKNHELTQFRPHETLGKYQEVKSYFSSAHKMRQDERADYTGASAEMIYLAKAIQKRMAAMHIPVYVHTCYRSPALQAELRARGHSQVVDGAHQRSAAIDIVHNHFHWNCDKEFWDLLGRVAKEVSRNLTQGSIHPKTGKRFSTKINWGGDWSFYDPAHIEFADWKKRPIVMKITDWSET